MLNQYQEDARLKDKTLILKEVRTWRRVGATKGVVDIDKRRRLVGRAFRDGEGTGAVMAEGGGGWTWADC